MWEKVFGKAGLSPTVGAVKTRVREPSKFDISVTASREGGRPAQATPLWGSTSNVWEW